MGCCISQQLQPEEDQLTIKQLQSNEKNHEKLNQEILEYENENYGIVYYDKDAKQMKYKLNYTETNKNQKDNQYIIDDQAIKLNIDKPMKLVSYSQYQTTSQTPPRSRRETIQSNQEIKLQNQFGEQKESLNNSKCGSQKHSFSKQQNDNLNQINQVEQLINQKKQQYHQELKQREQLNDSNSNSNKNKIPHLNFQHFEINTIQEENSQLFLNSPITPHSNQSEADFTHRSNNNNQKQQYTIDIVKYSNERKKYPPIQLPNGVIYEGDWKNGKQDGQGISQYMDQSIHEGEYKEGYAHGKGILTFQDGQYFIGEFQNNKQHGNGKYVQLDKEYTGQWVEGKQEGRGVETWGEKKENKYEGQYKNGMRHGKGKLVIKGHFSYIGDFQENEMHGFGKIKFEDDRIYEGQINQNKMHGKGKLQLLYINETYVGEFDNDNMQGIGTYYYNDKSKYIGGWLNNRQHGQGLLINNKGESLKGIWSNGECMQKKINISQKKSLLKSNAESSMSSIHKYSINQSIRKSTKNNLS